MENENAAVPCAQHVYAGEGVASSSSSSAAVAAIAIPRLNPPVMADTNIDAYFMSLEFWFAASGITAQHDSQRYNIVMAQVPPQKLGELRTIVENTPTSGKYAYIKSKLTEHFADSQQRRLHRVLSEMHLGDLKPSHLFNEMKRVAGDSLGDTLLLDLWAARHPAHAQAAVIASRGDAADKTADAIVESISLRNISSIGQETTTTALNVTSSDQQIQDLKLAIDALSKRLD